MKKQKHGFWVFIFSLIPGAGEMYMGFKKQGLSIMLLFWGSIALASITGLGWLAMFLPVIWFYSFFNVHNLKSLSEEEFYSVEDNYILHMDQFSGDMGKFLQKHQSLPQIVIAAGIIAAGIYLLTQQKKKLKQETETKDEHYWEPYRPYQQLTEKPVHTSDNSDKDTASETSSITDPENTESDPASSTK